MQVSQILKTKGGDVVTISPDSPILDAAQLLASKNIGAVVVAESGGKLAGILSERDIARAVAAGINKLSGLKVRDLMTAKVITCNPEQRTHELMQMMTNSRIRHLPVVEDDALVGVISIGDVVKFRLKELESEADALKEYIAG